MGDNAEPNTPIEDYYAHLESASAHSGPWRVLRLGGSPVEPPIHLMIKPQTTFSLGACGMTSLCSSLKQKVFVLCGPKVRKPPGKCYQVQGEASQKRGTSEEPPA